MAQSMSTLHEEQEDKITVFGKHLEVTPAMREQIVSRIRKIEEMTPPVVGVHVYLEIQREEHRVEIEYRFSHFRIVVSHVMVKRAHAKMDDMYHAIDLACDKLKRKIRRWKTRIQDHHGAKPAAIEERAELVLDRKTAEIDQINDLIEEESIKKRVE